MIDDHLCHLFLSLRLNRSSISLASCLVNYGHRIYVWLRSEGLSLHRVPFPKSTIQEAIAPKWLNWWDKPCGDGRRLRQQSRCRRPSKSARNFWIGISSGVISDSDVIFFTMFKCQMPVFPQSPHWAALPWIPLGIGVSVQVPGWFKCYSW